MPEPVLQRTYYLWQKERSPPGAMRSFGCEQERSWRLMRNQVRCRPCKSVARRMRISFRC